MGRGLLISLLLCSSIRGQILSGVIGDQKAVSFGGMGAWTLVSHSIMPGQGNDATVALPLQNCTGANVYILSTTSASSPPSVGRWDPGGNSNDIPNNTGWALGNTWYAGFYWADGVTGTPSVQFSTHNNYGALSGSCWGGASAPPAKDQESASGTVTCFPCTVTLTPTTGGTLLFLIGSIATGGTAASLSAAGFTVLDRQEAIPGTSFAAVGVFYKVLGPGTSGQAQSVTISADAGSTGTAKMVNFKHQ